MQAHGSEPTDGELSRATGLTRTQIESLLATQRRPRALEEPLGVAAEAVATVGDTIVDPVAEREYEQVLDEIEIHEVRDLADELDARERRVLRAHYGLGQPVQTLSEIGGEARSDRRAGAADRGRRATEAARADVAGRAGSGERLNPPGRGLLDT